ncbi:hypothetical protein J5J86_22805 [Aquabacter sp. L1I39]|uniref:hypothetical protein n=1 Tax=Aquabacter sp. L1I39 TaxID=2820278 RepID=UPI001ADD3941|nr:hypothetical protein [Aquabacter sp. L1I39]QTL03524.1 hypothetical protein J5J86_22805 [Aquabacter sp. L1I39]
MADIEAQFDQAMLQIYQRAKKEAKYQANDFLGMLMSNRGVRTAKTLINSKTESSGYAKLSELGRLDLTVEALVTEDTRWHVLFTDEELERARLRLKKYRYEPKNS